MRFDYLLADRKPEPRALGGSSKERNEYLLQVLLFYSAAVVLDRNNNLPARDINRNLYIAFEFFLERLFAVADDIENNLPDPFGGRHDFKRLLGRRKLKHHALAHARTEYLDRARDQIVQIDVFVLGGLRF